MSNRVETLGTYIRKIFDVNKDGQITFKDFLGLFPNNAVAIAVLFADAVVLFAEYRVWDFGMTVTEGDPYKALGFVLISAVPFYLGQVFWLYPRAVTIQKAIALGFIAGGLYASYVFGLADLSRDYNVPEIGKMLQKATVAYIIAGLIYVWQDPSIKAHRAKAVAHAAVELERELQGLTRSMLQEWRETKNMERETIDLFDGDEEAVIAQLQALRGKKPEKQDKGSGTSAKDEALRQAKALGMWNPNDPNDSPFERSRPDVHRALTQGEKPNLSRDNTTTTPDNTPAPPLHEFLKMSKSELVIWMEDRQLFGETETREALRREGKVNSDVSNNRFKKMFYNTFPERRPNFTQAVSDNHRQ